MWELWVGALNKALKMILVFIDGWCENCLNIRNLVARAL